MFEVKCKRMHWKNAKRIKVKTWQLGLGFKV
jgi:hypothetical protein